MKGLLACQIVEEFVRRDTDVAIHQLSLARSIDESGTPARHM
jgi:hypothetical protein